MLKLLRRTKKPSPLQLSIPEPQCSLCGDLLRFDERTGPIVSSIFGWDTDAVEAARMSKCEICKFCCAALDSIVSAEDITELQDMVVRATVNTSKSRVADTKVFRKHETKLRIQIESGRLTRRRTEWTIYLQKRSLALPFVRLPDKLTSRCFGNTGSPAAASWAKMEIDKCYAKHSICAGRKGNQPSKPKQKRLLPKRVIQLLENGKLRLNETAPNERDVYACLSHCWGGKQALTTTLATLPEHLKNVDVDSLPRTFKDAITFLRYLNIKYIWIDSLCIVQDSREDWFQESGNMAGIYANSFLTLAATRASNGEVGLFSDTVSVELNCGKSELLLCRLPNHPIPGSVTNEDFPLLSRGWVAQEILLSPRILHFCNGDLILECVEDIVCSCGESIKNLNGMKDKMWATSEEIPAHSTRTIRALLYQSSKHAAIKSKASVITTAEPSYFRAWREFASRYSKLSLTFQSDRLPAMAGLVHRFAAGYGKTDAKALGTTYAAGVWEENLHNDLLWFMPNIVKPQARAEGTTAPSWSWVSCGSVVAWLTPTAGAELWFQVVDVSKVRSCQRT
ncbi:HET-domain-containing protein [Microthyrium microscopicum]|uniref:HET-domain-containing protein n=1 Tax=Microthyrium microscopicum TaxID=703497 RepID=A0A6A6UEU3_9PEZI|nr:HET-domain-containing protein [Microthyrium microscopicum]